VDDGAAHELLQAAQVETPHDVGLPEVVREPLADRFSCLSCPKQPYPPKSMVLQWLRVQRL